MRFRVCLAVCLLWLGLVACSGGGETAVSPTDSLLVAAASDLQFAFPEIGRAFEQHTGIPVTFTFGSSGNLTTQVENGAPFDVIATANVAFVNRLEEQGLIESDTKVVYAQGHLVLAVNRAAGLVVTSLEDLRETAVTRVAIANPEHAPYGMAARQALQTSHIWDEIQDKIVFGENVRQTLQFVQTGDVPVGIISLSIANVPEITTIPISSELHDPINQGMAVLKSAPHPEAARQFVAFVTGEHGQAILQQYGFLTPEP
ncbi:MAG: molybdate ABC transporter substrate-binding protein [Chloroflexi bacterium]|nr:MAG: molybdate ABC transporter substrate-binding protein [Chloroflexota bacterium]